MARTQRERPPLAAMLVRLRESKGWSQKELAERIGGAVSVGFIGMVEIGDRSPSADTLNAIADALGATESERKTLDRLRRSERLGVLQKRIADAMDEPAVNKGAQPASQGGEAITGLTPEEHELLEAHLRLMRRDRGDR